MERRVTFLADASVKPCQNLEFVNCKIKFYLCSQYPKNVLFHFENKIADGEREETVGVVCYKPNIMHIMHYKPCITNKTVCIVCITNQTLCKLCIQYQILSILYITDQTLSILYITNQKLCILCYSCQQVSRNKGQNQLLWA